MTKNQLLNLADAQGKVTKFSKGTNIETENLLLTFTNIGKNVFPSALKAVNDMSQALGQDTKSSAIQLGKALNDPINGVTALKRVGVTFNDAQKEQISTMVKAGNVAGAQSVILQELQKEFGNSAISAGSTFGGQLTILKNQVSGVGTSIGSTLIPFLSDFVSKVNSHMPQIQKTITDVIKTASPLIKDIIKDVGSIVQNLLPSLGKASGNTKNDVIDFVKNGLTILKNILDWIASHGTAVKGTLIGIGVAFAAFKTVTGIVNGVTKAVDFARKAQQTWSATTKAFTVIQSALNVVLNMNPIGLIVIAIGAVVTALIVLFNHNKKFHDFVVKMWSDLKGVVGTAIKAISDFFNGFGENIKKVFNGIKSFFENIFNWLKSFFNKWGTVILAVIAPFLGIPLLIYKNFDKIKGWLSNIWDNAIKGISNFVSGAKKIISKIGDVIVHGFDSAINFIKSLPSKMLQWGEDMIKGLINGIKNMIGKVGDAAEGIANKIKSFLHFSVPDEGPLADADTYGGDFMDLIINGMGNKIDDAKNMSKKVAKTISDNLSPKFTPKIGTLNNTNNPKGNNSNSNNVSQKEPTKQNICNFHFEKGSIVTNDPEKFVNDMMKKATNTVQKYNTLNCY